MLQQIGLSPQQARVVLAQAEPSRLLHVTCPVYRWLDKNQANICEGADSLTQRGMTGKLSLSYGGARLHLSWTWCSGL